MLRRRSVPFVAVSSLVLLLALILSTAPAAFAQGGVRPAANLDGLLLDTPLEANLKIDEGVATSGRVDVVVRLSQRHAASQKSRGAAAERAQAGNVDAQQERIIALVQSADPSAVLLGRTRIVLNAVMFNVDAAALPAIAASADVVGVDSVVNYERDLTETVPYIGATPAVQAAGNKGAGVKVAVLDSGIDYTHVAFGGAGTSVAYQAAYGTTTADARNTTRDGLFPTPRVIEGYDFVGEVWTGGVGSPPLVPDEDPIDCGAPGLVTPGACAGGHGTNVADIIGGTLGVAPEVSLYAVKVCSAVSTSCSGVAILQGIDYSADPNGDSDTSDAVDIVNMSLGAPYGHNYDNAIPIAVDNATNAGILTVASAGNSADKPYITGTPAGARTALSVAQTEVPSSKIQIATLNSSAVSNVSIGAVFQPWAVPLAGTISAPVVYDTTNATTRLGCTNAAGASPWVGTPLAGKIVLVDRGTCSFSLKIANIAAAGGLAGIIVLIDTSLPFTGGFGGGTQTIPGYMIRLADGNLIKAEIANGATITLDPANQPSISGSVVGSSSRGPTLGQMFYGNQIQYGQLIKPDIGAPGASVSAVAGSGNGTRAFGGTSGAAPMVAGAAALLQNETNGQLSPQELKSLLMNTAETNIFNTPAIFGGSLAAITRIGGGEVRVDRAVASGAAAWEVNSRAGSISFGQVDVANATVTLRRTVVVRNYTSRRINYTITPTFRFADDVTNGAVSVSAPGTVSVPARSSRTFRVTLTIDGTKLRGWNLTSGAQGANADILTSLEYDGYLNLTTSDPANNIHLAWQVLPRFSGRVSAPGTATAGTPFTVSNNGVGPANIAAYSLIGTNPFQNSSTGAGQGDVPMNLKHVGYATFNGTGICPSNTYILSFAVNNYERTTHGVAPMQARINLDTDRDGTFDFQVRNADFTLNQLTDGRTLAWVVNLRTGTANAFFFADHSMNSANMVLNICGSQLADATRPAGLGGPLAVPAIGQLINAQAQAFDNYFTGTAKSTINGMVFAPGGEKYTAGSSIIPGGTSTQLTAVSTGVNLATTETGLLLLADGLNGSVKSGAPAGREAFVVLVQ